MSTDLGTPPILSPDEAERAVLLAAPRGYCAGVDRAVVTVEKALDLYGAPVYVRKQIVHNKHVVADLEARGAIFVEELDEVPEGATVVFSAHGVSPAVHAQAAERGPEDHRRDLPAGHQGAPRGEAVRRRGLRHPADRPRGPRGGRGHRRARRPSTSSSCRAPTTSPTSRSATPRKVAWLSQTTLSVDETLETVAAIRERFPAAARPAERRHLLRHPEPPARGQGDRPRRRPGDRGRLRQLLQLRAAGRGRPRGRRQSSYRVDDASEIDEAWLDGVRTVSVTSGASVPEELVRAACWSSWRRGATPTRRRCTAPRSR